MGSVRGERGVGFGLGRDRVGEWGMRVGRWGGAGEGVGWLPSGRQRGREGCLRAVSPDLKGDAC